MRFKYKTVLILAIVIFASIFKCTSITANNLELIKRDADLFVIYKGDTIILNNVLTPQLFAYYEGYGESGLFIVHEYYASRTKVQIKYSLQLKEHGIYLNKVICFLYDDRDGTPYGWIILTNIEFDSSNSNLDELITLNVKVDKKIVLQKNKSYQMVLIPDGNSQKYFFKAQKSDNEIEINVPIFYEDGQYLGLGKFHYETSDWQDLSMNFPIEFFEADYFLFDQVISISNVRLYNDIAFYLEQGHNFTESIVILEKIIENNPSRTVAYINLGDAYWGLKEYHKAKQAYGTYIQQMKAGGRESRIPSRVIERVE